MNNLRVCVVGNLLEYPLLVLAIFDIDPFMNILLNPFTGMRAKADFIGAACRNIIEPSEVEILEKYFNSS